MRLSEVIKGIKTSGHGVLTDTEITGISYDSRKTGQGHLFIATRGETVDGHDFIGQAISRGAAAVVCETMPLSGGIGAGTCGVPFVIVDDSREALALISNNFFNRPSEALQVTGVTGTNGKTTTSYLIKAILESWGKKVGLIGTIQYMIGDEVFPAPHTTPEAPEFQGLLEKMRQAGCTHVISEISSHALAQKRVDGTLFRSAVFTNLTREHLDFHETMEGYFSAKERLFRELLEHGGPAVINRDDAWGRRLIGSLSGNIISYGMEEGAELVAADIRNTFDGLTFNVVFEGNKYEVTSALTGLPNVYNILSAAGAAVAAGAPWEHITKGIKKAGTVAGRFERVDAGQGFLAVVDYAHTEDALERLIYTARGLTGGKIITVFGCGGNRDRGKRPAMGAISTRLSDLVIFTTDNPRSERPDDIISEIEKGAVRKNYLIEPDRKEAIRRAVLIARENDVVLVAGKGHEDYQEINGKRFHFSDREVLEEAIKQLINNN